MTTWTLTVTHPDGEAETIAVDEGGRLCRSHVSDQLTLTRLVGFAPRPLTHPTIDLTTAMTNPGLAIGMHPVFDTTLNRTTTLFAHTTGFTPQARDSEDRAAWFDQLTDASLTMTRADTATADRHATTPHTAGRCEASLDCPICSPDWFDRLTEVSL